MYQSPGISSKRNRGVGFRISARKLSVQDPGFAVQIEGLGPVWSRIRGSEFGVSTWFRGLAFGVLVWVWSFPI